MSLLQIVLLVLQLLKQLKSSTSAEVFVEQAQASGISLANGDLLKWLWENREQIIEIVLKLIEQISKTPPATVLTSDDLIIAIKSLTEELSS